jgi:hypothetical protein
VLEISFISVISAQEGGELFPRYQEVFENGTATLICSYSYRNEYQTVWQVNGNQTGYAICTNCGGSWSNCTAGGFLNQTNYSITCNQSVVSVSIMNVQRWHHGTWSCRLIISSVWRTSFLYVRGNFYSFTI